MHIQRLLRPLFFYGRIVEVKIGIQSSLFAAGQGILLLLDR